MIHLFVARKPRDLDTRIWTCPSCGTSHDRDLNAAMNIKNMGQIDLYGSKMSDAMADLDGTSNVVIPVALQKMAVKIERSDVSTSVGYGSEQTQRRSLVVSGS